MLFIVWKSKKFIRATLIFSFHYWVCFQTQIVICSNSEFRFDSGRFEILDRGTIGVNGVIQRTQNKLCFLHFGLQFSVLVISLCKSAYLSGSLSSKFVVCSCPIIPSLIFILIRSTKPYPHFEPSQLVSKQNYFSIMIFYKVYALTAIRAQLPHSLTWLSLLALL